MLESNQKEQTQNFKTLCTLPTRIIPTTETAAVLLLLELIAVAQDGQVENVKRLNIHNGCSFTICFVMDSLSRQLKLYVVKRC